LNSFPSAGQETAADRLYRTVGATFGVAADDLGEDASPDTIPAWDSLNHLTLVMALESEFGVELTAEDALQMRNLGVIRRVLRLRGAPI